MTGQDAGARSSNHTSALGAARGVMDPNSDPSAAMTMLEDGAGTLVIGDESALDAMLNQWAESGDLVSRGSVVTGNDLEKLTVALGIGGDKIARYIRTAWGTQPPAGELRLVTRGANGKYLSNVPAALPAVAAPAAVGLIALQVALDAAVQQIVQAVEKVQDSVDEVLRLASAERAGDVYGRRRLLQRMHDELRTGAELSDTDWSTVAGMGPDLEVGIESLRRYAVLLVTDLAERRSADDRAASLAKLNKTGRLGSVLRLLVTAEQSFYLWQLIRIRRVETVESAHLEQTVTSARTAVAEHHTLDLELSRAGRRHLAGCARLSLGEFHRAMSGRRLQREVAPLQAQLDEFAQARGLQAADWEKIVNPGVRDVLSAVRKRGDRAIGSGVGAVGRAGGSVERWAATRSNKGDQT